MDLVGVTVHILRNYGLAAAPLGGRLEKKTDFISNASQFEKSSILRPVSSVYAKLSKMRVGLICIKRVSVFDAARSKRPLTRAC